jgi:hypothetical protein
LVFGAVATVNNLAVSVLAHCRQDRGDSRRFGNTSGASLFGAAATVHDSAVGVLSAAAPLPPPLSLAPPDSLVARWFLAPRRQLLNDWAVGATHVRRCALVAGSGCCPSVFGDPATVDDSSVGVAHVRRFALVAGFACRPSFFGAAATVDDSAVGVLAHVRRVALSSPDQLLVTPRLFGDTVRAFNTPSARRRPALAHGSSLSQSCRRRCFLCR